MKNNGNDTIVVNICGNEERWANKLIAIKHYADKITKNNSEWDKIYIDTVLKIAHGEKYIIK